MPRYDRNFSQRRPGSGQGRYGRDDFAYRPGGRYLAGDRMRGDSAGAGAPEQFYGGRGGPAWGPPQRYDRMMRGPGGRGDGGFRGLPPGRWEAGQPWGGEGAVDRVQAADIMTRNPEAVTPATTLVDVARRMRDLDVGIMPVVDDLDSYRLQGVITDRDIAVRAAAEGEDMKSATAEKFMTRQVETVAETDHVREVLTVMKRERVRRVPVTDGEGRLTGIIAQADLAVHYAGLDLQRETEVEEVVERISEPARPNWGGEPRGRGGRGGGGGHDLTDRLREGWRTLRDEAQQMLGRGYDRDWR